MLEARRISISGLKGGIDILTNNEESYKFDKKVVKIFKALRLMEQQKTLEPKFSESVKELAQYLNEVRKSMFGDS